MKPIEDINVKVYEAPEERVVAVSDSTQERVLYGSELMGVKLAFFDVETTGLSPAKNGIHQISGSIWIDGERKETFNYKVRPNPKAIIEDEALAIGGVTREQVLAYIPMEEVYKELTHLLGKYVDKFKKSDKFFLVGYNNRSFDDQFLRGFFLQNGDKYFGSWFWSDSHDVLVMASVHLIRSRANLVDFKLATVASEFGVEVDPEKLHDASYDIEITEKIYFAILFNQ